MDATNWDEFRKFVRKNPQLCRRLREKLNYTRPEQIVRFLEDNRDVPTRYDKDHQDTLLPEIEQFPVLPPFFDPNEVNPSTPEFDDTFDAFHAARAWFVYSTLVLPPPISEPDGHTEYTMYDRFRYRIPIAPTMIIFRQGAMRAQTYLAERLQKEGWFDSDTRWYPDRRADVTEDMWFGKRSADGSDEALASKSNSREEWARAYTMWRLHGERTGLLIDPAKLARYQELARSYPNDNQINMLDEASLKAPRHHPRAAAGPCHPPHVWH